MNNNEYRRSAAIALIAITTSGINGCAIIPNPLATPAPELAEEAAADYRALEPTALTRDLDHALTPADPPDAEVNALDETVPVADFIPLVSEIEPVAAEPHASPDDAANTGAAASDADTTAFPTNEPEPDNSLWTRLRSGFALPDYDHPRVQRDLKWYAGHQNYLDRTFERATPYLHYIVEQVERRGIPLEIALLPVVESAFQPFAYSHGRAAGLWQFIPGTARAYGLQIDWWYDGRRDVVAATDAALTYLDYLQRRFDGDWLLALAAYNSGAGTVSRAIKKNRRAGKGTAYWDLSLPRETRGYVPKLLAIANLVADPDAHGVTLLPIENTPQLAMVNVDFQLDLALAAEIAGMDMETFYLLNPGFNRWATSPDSTHTLLLPIDRAERFREDLAQLPTDDRVKWIRHNVGQGETLGFIAQKYDTTVRNIQRINNIRGHLIRAGHHLLIPVASRDATSYAMSEEQRLAKIQNTPKGDRKVVHNVQPGDTLWDISMAHNIPVRRLAAWNNMAPGDYLRPGQELVIWVNAPQTVTAPVAIPASTAVPSATRKINYRVRRGDSLARIAQRFNVRVTDLLTWNPSAKGQKYIQPGQLLVVYVDVTRAAESS